MISAHLIRLKFGPLRAALWTAWFPLLTLHYAGTALVQGWFWRRATWQCLGAFYLIGIDGIE